jgi:hypothetical protein
MRSRIAAVAAMVAVASALVLGGTVAPASAAADSVLVSRDGVTFATTLDGGLFDGAGMLIPGQSVSRSLYIRNPSGAASALRVSIRNLVSTSTVFAEGVSLSSLDSVPGSTPVSQPLSALSPCDVVTSAASIAAGDTVKLTLTFTMADLTASVAQSDRASLDLMVAMRDAAAGAFSGSACRDDGTLPVPLIAGGGLLLGVGMFLIVARRRRQSEDD